MQKQLFTKTRWLVTIILLLSLGIGNAWGAYDYSGTGTFYKQSTIDGNGYYVIILSNSGAMTNSASSNYVGVNTGYNGTSSETISNPATSVVLQVTNYDSSNKKYYISNNSGNYLYSSADKKIAYSATSQYWKIATVSNKVRLMTAQATVVHMGYVANSGFRPYTNASSNVQTVTAVYKWKCTVSYNANGGTGTMTDSNSPYAYGATVTVKSNSFTRDGYTFDHWDTKADDSGNDYAGSGSATFTISANTTLYAQWVSSATCSTDPEVRVSNNSSFS